MQCAGCKDPLKISQRFVRDDEARLLYHKRCQRQAYRNNLDKIPERYRASILHDIEREKKIAEFKPSRHGTHFKPHPETVWPHPEAVSDAAWRLRYGPGTDLGVKEQTISRADALLAASVCESFLHLLDYNSYGTEMCLDTLRSLHQALRKLEAGTLSPASGQSKNEGSSS